MDAALPTRIGGLETIAATRRSAGTSSGRRTLTGVSGLACCFRFFRVSSSARLLTSTAQIGCPGRRSESRADRPVATSDVHYRSGWKLGKFHQQHLRPGIDAFGGETPRSECNSTLRSGRVSRTVDGFDATFGSSVK